MSRAPSSCFSRCLRCSSNSLDCHAFVFLDFSLLFLARESRPFLPAPVNWIIGLSLFAWLLAYLPIALRRVYGGSRLVTAVKLGALGVLYLGAFAAAQPILVGAALLQF